MSAFINKGNDGFSGARQGEYVDKSALIAVINSTLGTERRFSCVSRSRRFGKSMAVKMLCAYYDESCDSRFLFDDLHISADTSYMKHLNNYGNYIFSILKIFVGIEQFQGILSGCSRGSCRIFWIYGE